jgi:fatty acid desaturase
LQGIEIPHSFAVMKTDLQAVSEIQIARPTNIEWLTLALNLLNYAALAMLMWFYESLPFWIIVPVAGYLIALHGSFQHEALHGHPTKNRAINEALVYINPSFWFPYRRYRKLHLMHHNDGNLTDPVLDPESYYMLPDEWANLSKPKQTLYLMNNSLAGRLIMGPIIGTTRFMYAEAKLIIAGDREVLVAWAWHVPACAITLSYAMFVCGIPLWAYLVMFAWPGIGLSLLRSFCEHQAVKDHGERTIVVESSWPLSFMFLNNNLHIAHHSQPRMAWYKLPSYYRTNRDQLLKQNRGYLMRGYREIFWRYFLTPKEPVVHPHPEWLREF